MYSKTPLKAVSLFSSGGIGDLGVRAAGIELVCANELLADRAELLQQNFPECAVIEGDIYSCKEEIVYETKERLKGQELFALFATPPCQGMSSNGAGKLLKEIKAGNRPKFDPRNSLILPALDVATALRPRWVVFENVVGMENTVIEQDGKPAKILDIVQATLGEEYAGKAYRVNVADYGVPQRRTRLITVYTRDANAKKALRSGAVLVPPATHPQERGKWISVNEAIGHFPPLDSKSKKTAKSKNDFLHQVPVLDEDKYFWISNTPINETAFNNQCVNPKCCYQNNPRHGTTRVKGVNRSNENTPLNCAKCGSVLPRPWVKTKNGKIRLMRGYVSAYKRMNGDLPAPTLTTNFTFPCSDHKVHPAQNRVLSLAEACELQTISKYAYVWQVTGNGGKKEQVPVSLIREVIGESVPPFFVEQEFRYLVDMSQGQMKVQSQRRLAEAHD